MLDALLRWTGWERTTLSAKAVTVHMLDGPPPAEPFPAIPEEGRLEMLFCREGGLTLELYGGRRLALRPAQVLVLPARAGECRCRFELARFCGVLLSGEEETALEVLTCLCPRLEREPPGADHGCAVVEAALWSEALFNALDSLPAERRGDYCAIKALELLYLVHAGGSELARPYGNSYYDRHQIQTVRQVLDYMLGHLEERITIPQLAERFHLSATVLKACFRQLYGMPIHQYLLNCRMSMAAQLLSTTRQPILQVAAAVGYGSISQFSTAFKSRYGMGPGQYRRAAEKMSVSVIPRPKRDEADPLEEI